MIVVESEDGGLVKVIQAAGGRFGFHEKFGLIGRESASKRVEVRKRKGYDHTKDRWHCSFHIDNKEELALSQTAGCKAVKIAEGWFLETALGKFRLSSTETPSSRVESLLESHSDRARWLNRLLEMTMVLTFLLIPVLFYLQKDAPEEAVEEEEIEPLVVKIVKPVKAVNIKSEAVPKHKVKPLTKADVFRRAVKRNLGFLGMVGSKDLKKVVGGVPQQLAQASAGAGPGGDAGSGGEVLTGLGRGLRKTTVGNTGVKGLGGIGTKGAGGGKGGYGNTLVASGSGRGISAIAVSGSDMVLQGGISRYAINATIAKYLNQIRRCYETQLKTRPNLQGLVEMSFEINPTGRLNFARVNRSTLKNGPTENCISQKMMTWQFPKPKGAVKVPVKYPFMLRPVGS